MPLHLTYYNLPARTDHGISCLDFLFSLILQYAFTLTVTGKVTQVTEIPKCAIKLTIKEHQPLCMQDDVAHTATREKQVTDLI